MSSSLGNVVVAIKAVDEVSGVMGKIQASMGVLGGTLQSLGGGFSTVGNVIQGFAAGGVAGAAITAVGEITRGLESCIKEATSSEAVWASLGAAVTRSGIAWDTVKTATEGALLAMSKTTTYSDEQLAAALEKLMTFGLSYDDAMQALGKSIDFAAAKHMDLESAATIVGKAMDGNTAILKRYGVDIASSKDAAAALKDAHDAAGTAIKAMGASVDAWVTSVTAAIGADSTFESGLAGAKDKAQYLIDQFKQGNIDLPQFTQAMTSLGVPLDEAKMKGGTATEVLAKLNEQFGGAAQAAAGTYAGIQERLKNATGEVGEKIGTIFLPALASATEAMIPLVDAFGKGVDAAQAWFTEMAKTPEVKGFVDALGPAWDSFMGYLNSVWKVIQDSFGPALQELWGALKDIWDALQPAIDAFKEIFGALSSGGEDVDAFKLLIQYLAAEIRVIADVIKFVAPYIKQFAEAFKAAANFISPVLAQMSKDIGGFIDWLKTAFSDFYTWLVGGSLWQDMWNALTSIASTMIGALLGDLGAKFFEPMKAAFTGAMQTVKDIWDTSWQAVQTTFDTITSQIQTGLNTRFDEMKTFVTANLGEYAPIANNALSGMQSAMNAVMALIHGDWQGFLDGMSQATYIFWNVIQGATTTAFSILQSSFTGSMDTIKGILDAAISFMQGAWGGFSDFMSRGIDALKGAISGAQSWLESTYASMQATASSAMSALEGIVMAAVNAIVAAAQSLWSQLVGGSIWTDLMETMQSQAYSALGNIADAFQDMSLAVPATIPYLPPAVSSGGVGPATSQGAAQAFSFTIPVTVTLDGQVISRQVEQRIVERVNLRGKKVA